METTNDVIKILLWNSNLEKAERDISSSRYGRLARNSHVGGAVGNQSRRIFRIERHWISRKLELAESQLSSLLFVTIFFARNVFSCVPVRELGIE